MMSAKKDGHMIDRMMCFGSAMRRQLLASLQIYVGRARDEDALR